MAKNGNSARKILATKLKNSTKYKRKPSLHLIVRGRLFYYDFFRNGGDFLTIEEYIKSKEKFRLMPFVTIYTAIMELINDGYIEQTAFEKAGGSDVAVHKQKSTWAVSG